MQISVRDPFLSPGKPSIVLEKDEKNSLMLDSDLSHTQEVFRHGYHKGIPSKELFDRIMDEAQGLKNHKEKVEFLQKKIQDMSESNKDQNLMKYLKGELAHMMNFYHISPRFYEITQD